jgi:hypothetical protein
VSVSLFSKPVASVYVDELRKRLDKRTVPVFPPDTTIEVGDFGSFEDGRFEKRGNVGRDRGLVFEVTNDRVGAFDFGSAGKVELGPSVELPNPVGGTLLKSTIRFTSSRAVVVSFKGGVEMKAQDADAFSEDLLKLWFSRELPTDRAVVWSVRRMDGGTAIVSESGDNTLDVMADSALLGPAGITIPNLALGVTFGTERQATWKLSSPDLPLLASIRLVRLRRDHVEDAFRFEPGRDDLDSAVAGKELEDGIPDELLEQLGLAEPPAAGAPPS